MSCSQMQGLFRVKLWILMSTFFIENVYYPEQKFDYIIMIFKKKSRTIVNLHRLQCTLYKSILLCDSGIKPISDVQNINNVSLYAIAIRPASVCKLTPPQNIQCKSQLFHYKWSHIISDVLSTRTKKTVRKNFVFFRKCSI